MYTSVGNNKPKHGIPLTFLDTFITDIYDSVDKRFWIPKSRIKAPIIAKAATQKSIGNFRFDLDQGTR